MGLPQLHFLFFHALHYAPSFTLSVVPGRPWDDPLSAPYQPCFVFPLHQSAQTLPPIAFPLGRISTVAQGALCPLCIDESLIAVVPRDYRSSPTPALGLIQQ